MTAHPVDGPVMRVAVGGLVDSHCHITASEFDEDREETLQRASAAGVDVIVAVSEGVREAQQLLVFAEAHNAMHKTPRVVVCIGIHPWNVNMEDELADMLALIRQHAAALVGVGEVGLDYMPKTLLGGVSKEDLEARGSDATGEMAASVKRRQQRCLVAQLQLAKELGLPLNVHSCSAGHHTLDLLRDHGAERVLLHAFDGKVGPSVRERGQGLDASLPGRLRTCTQAPCSLLFPRAGEGTLRRGCRPRERLFLLRAPECHPLATVPEAGQAPSPSELAAGDG